MQERIFRSDWLLALEVEALVPAPRCNRLDDPSEVTGFGECNVAIAADEDNFRGGNVGQPVRMLMGFVPVATHAVVLLPLRLQLETRNAIRAVIFASLERIPRLGGGIHV